MVCNPALILLIAYKVEIKGFAIKCFAAGITT